MLALFTQRPIVRLSTDAKPAGVEKGSFVYYADTGESFYADGQTLIPLPTVIPAVLSERLDNIASELAAIRRGIELTINHELSEG